MDKTPYMVVQDGKPLQRGLSFSEAHAYAERLARGYESHRGSDKRRVAEFNVVKDVRFVKEHDENYKWLKENI